MNKTVSINGRKAKINLEDGFLSINYRGHEMNLELNEFSDISDIVSLMSGRTESIKEREVEKRNTLDKYFDKIKQNNLNDLRDEFAKAALGGIIVKAVNNKIIIIVKDAYDIANAMLEERKKHIKKG